MTYLKLHFSSSSGSIAKRDLMSGKSQCAARPRLGAQEVVAPPHPRVFPRQTQDDIIRGSTGKKQRLTVASCSFSF